MSIFVLLFDLTSHDIGIPKYVYILRDTSLEQANLIKYLAHIVGDRHYGGIEFRRWIEVADWGHNIHRNFIK